MFRSSEWLVRANAAVGIFGYVGAIAIIGAFILAPRPAWAWRQFGVSGWMLFVLALLGVAPASDAAVALVNRGVGKVFGARTLPAMELANGVPASLRTMVVVPTLLTTQAETRRADRSAWKCITWRARMAISASRCSRTGPTPRLHDAPDDDALLGAAAAGIARLNQRHGSASEGARFFLLHRRRLWNEGQGKWIGWERKRGKLHELNRLLRGATDTTFVAIDGLTYRRTFRRSLRDHARRRYPAAARNRPAPDRQNGASAQPAAAGSG